MKRLNILIIMCVLSVIMVGCNAKAEKVKPIFDENNGIISQGVIEVKEVSLNSKIPGRIEKIFAEEGQEVSASDVVVKISSDEIKAKENQALALVSAANSAYKAAKGQVEAANAMVNKAENGAREQEIAQAQSYCTLMEKTYQRVENLYEKGAVSAQKKDEVKTQLEVAKQQLSMANEGARVEDKSGAQAVLAQAMAMEQAALSKLKQAEAGVEEVRAYLNDTEIKAPINGIVTVMNSDEGELVSSGMSIATISNISNPWIEVNINETDLARIYLGQKVSVKIPSYSEEVYTGKVVRINNKADFATKKSTNDNGDFDIVSYGVKVSIDNNNQILRPGMTAFVQFEGQENSEN